MLQVNLSSPASGARTRTVTNRNFFWNCVRRRRIICLQTVSGFTESSRRSHRRHSGAVAFDTFPHLDTLNVRAVPQMVVLTSSTVTTPDHATQFMSLCVTIQYRPSSLNRRLFAASKITRSQLRNLVEAWTLLNSIQSQHRLCCLLSERSIALQQNGEVRSYFWVIPKSRGRGTYSACRNVIRLVKTRVTIELQSNVEDKIQT